MNKLLYPDSPTLPAGFSIRFETGGKIVPDAGTHAGRRSQMAFACLAARWPGSRLDSLPPTFTLLKTAAAAKQDCITASYPYDLSRPLFP
jgi:hypothetical protein